MDCNPRGCPFCLTTEIRQLANFHDTLAAYACPRCGGEFYTIHMRFVAAPPAFADFVQRRPRTGPLSRPSGTRSRPHPSLARWLPSARTDAGPRRIPLPQARLRDLPAMLTLRSNIDADSLSSMARASLPASRG